MSETTIRVDELDEIERMMAAEGLITGVPAGTTDDEPQEIVVQTVETDLDAVIPAEAIEAAPETVETITEIGDEELEGLVNELALEETKQELYAEQSSAVDVADEPAPAKGKAKKAKTGTGSPVPRVSRLAGTTHGAYVASKLSDEEIAAKVDGLPVKVKDKATNLVDHIRGGKALSVYTQVAVNMLRTEGVITNAKLVEALQAQAKRSNASAGYSIGTARSQAGQMMALFGKLGIATQDGAKGLVPNPESPIWQALSGAA